MTVTEQTPVLTLMRIRVEEARKPNQRNAHPSTVRKGDRQLVVANRNLHGSWVGTRA